MCAHRYVTYVTFDVTNRSYDTGQKHNKIYNRIDAGETKIYKYKTFFQIKKINELAIGRSQQTHLLRLSRPRDRLHHGVLRHHSFLYKAQNN